MSTPAKDFKIRGTILENVPLGQQSWFHCGGSVDLLFEPADLEDLTEFLHQSRAADHQSKITILGGLANTIIRDGGVRGTTIRLGKPFSEVTVQGTTIIAGAGALNGTVASVAAKNGIGGLEFLSGIPGTVGGALRMNAGAYGTEIKDVLTKAASIDSKTAAAYTHTPAEMAFSYRHCGLPEEYIFTEATFEGKQEDKNTVRARLKDIKTQRQETQPITEQTGGSTFANPNGLDIFLQTLWSIPHLFLN